MFDDSKPHPARATAPESRGPARDFAWEALLACAAMSRGGALAGAKALGRPGRGELRQVAADCTDALFVRRAAAWEPGPALEGESRTLAELYLGCATIPPAVSYLVGHLGQSLDGNIATLDGDSNYITGHDNIVHLHRMRALFSAVVVGAGTVAADDPELTTRLVEGPNPVRIVIDPRRKLPAEHRVFDTSVAPTWLVCAEELAEPSLHGRARVLGVPAVDGNLDLQTLTARLAERGMNSLFMEGGGNTVSRFLEAGLLDRLQIAVAPLVIGEGTPGLRMPARSRLRDCLRAPGRAYRMGADVLFDCDLRTRPTGSGPSGLASIY